MSLTAILAALQAVNALLPEVTALIATIEKAFPNATLDAKLNQVLAVLNGLGTVESELASPFSLVTGLVSNLFGTHASTPVKTATPAPSAAGSTLAGIAAAAQAFADSQAANGPTKTS